MLLSEVRISRAVLVMAFDADHRPVLSLMEAAEKTLPVLAPKKRFSFWSAETSSAYNSSCVARNTGNFSEEKRLRRKLRRQLKRDHESEWTSRTKEFEKAWKDKNQWKVNALLENYSGLMKKC
ncbi:hypothetical protein RB195_024588 [Necator americanus]|uniref:Uncharacterized protein n=1 Tax=Necator americanus TaxID=51031 RepID=A0ABR1ER01_NECAM